VVGKASKYEATYTLRYRRNSSKLEFNLIVPIAGGKQNSTEMQMIGELRFPRIVPLMGGASMQALAML
jgi:hypothetical protein